MHTHTHTEIRLSVMGVVPCLHGGSIPEPWHSLCTCEHRLGEERGEEPGAGVKPRGAERLNAPSPAAILPLLHQNRSCQALFRVLLPSFAFPFRADVLPRRDLSSRCGRTAVPRSSALVPAARARLPSPSSVSLRINAGRAVSNNISEGIGPEVKPAPLFWQEPCVGCCPLLQLMVL